MFILGGLGQRWDIQHAPFMQYPRSGGPWSVGRPAKKKVRIASKEQFLKWAESEFPEGMAVAKMEAQRRGLSGLGQRYKYRWTQDMNVRMRSFQGLGQAPQASTPTVGPAGGVEDKPWYEKGLDLLVDSAQKVLPQYLKYAEDKAMLDLNLRRMKSGLLPAEGEFAMRPQDVRDSYPVEMPTAQTPDWLIPVAIGAGALILLMPRR